MISFFKSLFKKERTIYEGEVVYLKKRNNLLPYINDPSATIYYDIFTNDDNRLVGHCDLRTKREDGSYYYGDIGYSINKNERGHRYAYYACLIMMKIAKKEYDMKEIIITCSPENVASYKTLEALDGQLLEIADVPSNHELYQRGETKKCIFKYIL